MIPELTSSTAMEYRILGPIEVHVAGRRPPWLDVLARRFADLDSITPAGGG